MEEAQTRQEDTRARSTEYQDVTMYVEEEVGKTSREKVEAGQVSSKEKGRER